MIRKLLPVPQNSQDYEAFNAWVAANKLDATGVHIREMVPLDGSLTRWRTEEFVPDSKGKIGVPVLTQTGIRTTTPAQARWLVNA